MTLAGNKENPPDSVCQAGGPTGTVMRRFMAYSLPGKIKKQLITMLSPGFVPHKHLLMSPAALLYVFIKMLERFSY